MNCKRARQEFFGLSSGTVVDPRLEQHLRECAACSSEAASFREMMALLDDWKAPEPSPYFAARVRARLHEAPARRTVGEWLRDAVSPFTVTGRRVALGVAMTLLLAVGVTLVQPGRPVPAGKGGDIQVQPAAPGTAVGDLQALDKNADLYAGFDLLDDVSNN